MSTMQLTPQANELLFVGFNQDHGCFACGTEKGFIVYNCDPLKERFRRQFDQGGGGGGIGIVEILFRCNILALVGGGKSPKYPPNKVMIWDDYQNKCIAELEFQSDVMAVRLRRDRIVVVLINKIYVYNFADLQLLRQIETEPNPRGVCALCPSSSTTVLACPSPRSGWVHVEHYDTKKSHDIQAHNNPLCQIALNSDGSLLATASEKGTLIRIFDTHSKQRLREFRRGADRAEIYSLAFHPQSSWLCVSSDKGTVHIYSLAAEGNPRSNPDASAHPGADGAAAEEPANRQSSFSFMKDILPSYFSSEWSHSQFSLPDTRKICCFGKDNSVIAVCADGSYYKYVFDPDKAGDAKQEGYAIFLKQGDD